MKNLLFILLICLGGCVSRQSYLRDRLQDSLDKQEQKAFNAEVLRKLEDGTYQDMHDLQTRIIALEKKMDERKEPCPGAMGTVAPITQKRPNFPCPYCDGSAPKP